MIGPSELRLFVAVELDQTLRASVIEAGQTVRRAIQAKLKANRAGDPLKWVPSENMHLTLKFLGETPRHVLPDIDAALAEATHAATPFTITAAGAGAFPSTGRPRVIWLGATVDREPVRRLRQAIDDGLARLGFARETRPFAAHLTLARVREAASTDEVRWVGEALQKPLVGEIGAMTVASITLMRSDLLRTGSVYTPLHVYELGSRSAVGASDQLGA